MIDKAELIALAERVEALTEPDGDMDGAIYAALNPHMRALPDNLRRFYDPALTTERAAKDYHIAGATAYAPPFTASLDAAMGLVPEGWEWQVTSEGKALVANIAWAASEAPTPALALTAAALRARAGQEPR